GNGTTEAPSRALINAKACPSLSTVTARGTSTPVATTVQFAVGSVHSSSSGNPQAYRRMDPQCPCISRITINGLQRDQTHRSKNPQCQRSIYQGTHAQSGSSLLAEQCFSIERRPPECCIGRKCPSPAVL